MISDFTFYSEKEKKFDLRMQQMDIIDCYPASKVEIIGHYLKAQLWVKDGIYVNDYRVMIYYKPNVHPFVFIVNPKIKPKASIHMYSDGHLCLYHPAHIGYRHHFSIAREIIPLTIKWIHYYEVWLENGNHWIGPETPHGSRIVMSIEQNLFRA